MTEGCEAGSGPAAFGFRWLQTRDRCRRVDDAGAAATGAAARQRAGAGLQPGLDVRRGERDLAEELSDPKHRQVLDTYRALITLRRTHPELTDPRLDQFTVDTDDGWLVLHRGRFRVAYNLDAEPVVITLDQPVEEVLLASAEPTASGKEITLPAESFGIVWVRRVTPRS